MQEYWEVNFSFPLPSSLSLPLPLRKQMQEKSSQICPQTLSVHLAANLFPSGHLSPVSSSTESLDQAGLGAHSDLGASSGWLGPRAESHSGWPFPMHTYKRASSNKTQVHSQLPKSPAHSTTPAGVEKETGQKQHLESRKQQKLQTTVYQHPLRFLCHPVSGKVLGWPSFHWVQSGSA